MNRGNITARPQVAVSYSNPNAQAPQNQPPTPTTQTVPAGVYVLGGLTTVSILPQ